jgi:CheY-like chemotaxis protein
MILLVDDDPVFLEEAYTLLTPQRHVLFARTAYDAFKLLEVLSGSLAAAVVDLDLPDVDGFALIRHMRTAYPSLPVIAMSGVLQEAALQSAKLMGASDVLHKPISPEWNAVIEHSATRH